MVNVPKLRFAEFEGEWKKKTLGDLGKFYNGLRGKNKDYFVNGNKKYIQYLNIFQNTIIDNNFKDYNYVLVEDNENQNQVKYGDLLFTQSSETYEEIGMTSVYLGTIEIYLNSFSFGFRFDNPNDISFKYIAYLFESEFMRRKIIKEGQGSTRINLSSNRLKNINLPLPIKKEQEKIGSFFSKIDKKIELQEQLIENLEEQKKGLMQKIFNQEVRFKDENGKDYPEWEEKKLGEINKISIYQPQTIASNKFINDGEYRVFGANGYIGRLNKYNHKLPQITISCRGENSGTVNYVDEECWITGNSMVINLDDVKNIDKLFLYYELSSQNLKYMVTGSGQPQIIRRDVELHSIIIPIEEEQQKIADFLSTIDEKIEIEKEILETLKDIKKGLLQQMFI